MSKELEALDRIFVHRFDEQYKDWDIDYELVENYLKSIDNSKPSEALECLEKLNDMFYLIKYRTTEGGNREEYEFYPSYTKEYSTIENYILKAQEKEKDKVFLKNLHNTKVKTPLVDIFRFLSQEKKFAYTEHIYYHWEEIKESLEAEIKTLKDEKENLESKIKKQEKVIKIITKKEVDIGLLKRSENWLDYYTRVKHKIGKDTELTEEEFDLLKRIFTIRKGDGE